MANGALFLGGGIERSREFLGSCEWLNKYHIATGQGGYWPFDTEDPPNKQEAWTMYECLRGPLPDIDMTQFDNA